MEFNVSADLVYNAEEAGTLVLNIRPIKVVKETLTIGPGTLNYTDYFSDMNRLLMLPVSEPGEIRISYKATALNQFKYVDFATLEPSSISQMVPSVLSYLNPSRYCQSDKLLRFAMHLFGHIKNEFEKVITITEQVGVCRDFAHLGLALCRALDIPARYCSVYAYNLKPADFHACFEAWLSGHWIIFDATKLAPLNGFVKISMGLDAADTSISNLFGKIIPQSMTINSDKSE